MLAVRSLSLSCTTLHIASHLGAHKTLAALQQRVWWPSMQQDICKYVAECLVGQRFKDVNKAPAGLL